MLYAFSRAQDKGPRREWMSGVEAEVEVGLGRIIQGTGAGFDSLFLVAPSLSRLT